MKKVFIFVALVSIAFSYSSCRKNPRRADSTKPNTDQVSNRYGSATMIWWLPFSACAGEPKDCGPETVIVGKRIKLNGLITTVNEDGSAGVGEFFSNTENWDVFPANYPSTQQMQNLASGNYKIIIIQSTTDENTYYFLCGPEATLTTSNPEFVVQGTYED